MADLFWAPIFTYSLVIGVGHVLICFIEKFVWIQNILEEEDRANFDVV